MSALARAFLIGAAFGLAGEAAAAPDAARQAELVHRLKHDCGSCHGMTMKGGLGPPLLPTSLAGKPDAFLVEVILDGTPGTPMPPWRQELSAGEAGWMVQLLKKGLPP
ncbi:MAG: cytochrome c [Pseudomonadota bacterium]